GYIYNCALGYYNRAAVVTGEGAVVGNGTDVPTPEEVAAQWENINSLEGGKEFSQVGDQLMDALSKFPS
ncbi:MAG: hypothetical protein JRI53_03900, partial [Deltaproteobacteria bacterium]|nr:hypothetical protein [Deltaproteobacteria bacterium]